MYAMLGVLLAIFAPHLLLVYSFPVMVVVVKKIEGIIEFRKKYPKFIKMTNKEMKQLLERINNKGYELEESLEKNKKKLRNYEKKYNKILKKQAKEQSLVDKEIKTEKDVVTDRRTDECRYTLEDYLEEETSTDTTINECGKSITKKLGTSVS